MSEMMPEQSPERGRHFIMRLPGTITERDLALQGEYDSDFLRPDLFANPALRHEPTEDERHRAAETNDNVWEG